MQPDKKSRPASNGAASDDHLAGGSLHIVDRPSDTATDLEFATIGAVVLAVASVKDVVLSIVRDDDFSDPRCKFVVGVVRHMRATGLPVDQITLCGFVIRNGLLAGGPRVNLASWLAEITSAVPVPASAPWYADGVVEAAARQRARWAATAIADAANDGALADLQSIVTTELNSVTAAVQRVRSVANV